MRRIGIVPYNPVWPSSYEQEAAWIASEFGDELERFYHIGSTTIPGMWAKPVIDISRAHPQRAQSYADLKRALAS